MTDQIEDLASRVGHLEMCLSDSEAEVMIVARRVDDLLEEIDRLQKRVGVLEDERVAAEFSDHGSDI